MTLVDALKYLDYFVLIPAASRLPVRWFYAVADARGKVRLKMRDASCRRARSNVASTLPALSGAEVDRVVLESFQARVRDEMEPIWHSRPWSFFEKFVDVSGLAETRAAVESGRGVLLFSGHLGSLGLFWLLMARLGIRVHVIARPIEEGENSLHPAERAYARRKIGWIEGEIGHPFLLTGRGNYPTILELIDRGEVVVIVTDVPPTVARRTVPVDFFGEPAAFPDGIAALYSRTGARLVSWQAGWHPEQGRFKIVLADRTRDVDRSAPVEDITQQLVTFTEEMIRSDPGRWHAWDSLQLFRQPTNGERRTTNDE